MKREEALRYCQLYRYSSSGMCEQWKSLATIAGKTAREQAFFFLIRDISHVLLTSSVDSTSPVNLTRLVELRGASDWPIQRALSTGAVFQGPK